MASKLPFEISILRKESEIYAPERESLLEGWLGLGAPMDSPGESGYLQKIITILTSKFNGGVKQKVIYQNLIGVRCTELFKIIKEISERKETPSHLDLNTSRAISSYEKIDFFLNQTQGAALLRDELINRISKSSGQLDIKKVISDFPCPLLRMAVRLFGETPTDRLAEICHLANNRIGLLEYKADRSHVNLQLTKQAYDLWLCELAASTLNNIEEEKCPDRLALICSILVAICTNSENIQLRAMLGPATNYCGLMVMRKSHPIGNQIPDVPGENRLFFYTKSLSTLLLSYSTKVFSLYFTDKVDDVDLEVIAHNDESFSIMLSRYVSGSRLCLDEEMDAVLQSMNVIQELFSEDGEVDSDISSVLDECKEAKAALLIIDDSFNRAITHSHNKEIGIGYKLLRDSLSQTVSVSSELKEMSKEANIIISSLSKAGMKKRSSLALKLAELSDSIRESVIEKVSPSIKLTTAKSNAIIELLNSFDKEAQEEPRETVEILKEKLKKLHNDHSALLENYTASEAELTDIRSMSEILMEEEKELKSENSSLKLEVETLKANVVGANDEMQKRVSRATSDIATTCFTLVNDLSVRNVLEAVKAAYPDRIKVLEDVYKLENTWTSDSDLPVKELLSRLVTLATDGADYLRQDGAQFYGLKDIVPGGVSAQESETVRKNPKLLKYRTFRDGDTDVVILSHIDLGYSHRLYFDFCVESQKIRVGYIGRHLPTARYS